MTNTPATFDKGSLNPTQISTSASAGALWSARWHGLMDELGYDMRRGRSHARRGKVTALEVQVGRVTAQVQDQDLGDCNVEVLLTTHDDAAWNRVLDALGGQALYAAQLLAGDLPHSIDERFQAEGVHLLPAGRYEMEANCSVCAGWEQPCKHVAAVLFVMGQMLDEDPWLLFRLRGRDRQQVLQAMRQRRSEGDEPSAPPALERRQLAAPAAGYAGVAALQENSATTLPLSAQIDNFWGRSKQLADLHHHISPPAIRLALLRRLGHPPFRTDSLETYDQLVAVYEAVSAAALALAFAPEVEE